LGVERCPIDRRVAGRLLLLALGQESINLGTQPPELLVDDPLQLRNVRAEALRDGRRQHRVPLPDLLNPGERLIQSHGDRGELGGESLGPLAQIQPLSQAARRDDVLVRQFGRAVVTCCACLRICWPRGMTARRIERRRLVCHPRTLPSVTDDARWCPAASLTVWPSVLATPTGLSPKTSTASSPASPPMTKPHCVPEAG
jgi:hypothetical protein